MCWSRGTNGRCFFSSFCLLSIMLFVRCLMVFCELVIIRVLLLVYEISILFRYSTIRLVTEGLNVGRDNGEWKDVLTQLLEVEYYCVIIGRLLMVPVSWKLSITLCNSIHLTVKMSLGRYGGLSITLYILDRLDNWLVIK